MRCVHTALIEKSRIKHRINRKIVQRHTALIELSDTALLEVDRRRGAAL
jgi:hypothetical protein